MGGGFSWWDLKNGTKTPTADDLKQVKRELECLERYGTILREQALWLERMDRLIEIAEQAERKEQAAALRVVRQGERSEQHFRFRCPSCNWSLKAMASHVGKTAKCPNCQHELVIPSPIGDTESSADEGRPPSSRSGAGRRRVSPVTGGEYRAFIGRAEELLPRLQEALAQVIRRVLAAAAFELPASLQLQRDLAFMAVKITHADDDFAEQEMLMLSDVLALLIGQSSTLFLDALNSERQEVRQALCGVIESFQTPTTLQLPGWE